MTVATTRSTTEAGVGVATIYRRWDGFIEIWTRAWSWATSNRDMFTFINASLGAPWLSDELAARKATMTEAEVGTYARFELDATPDFAAALIGGALMSVLTMEPDVEPDEVGARLWRALRLDAD